MESYEYETDFSATEPENQQPAIPITPERSRPDLVMLTTINQKL